MIGCALETCNIPYHAYLNEKICLIRNILHKTFYCPDGIGREMLYDLPFSVAQSIIHAGASKPSPGLRFYGVWPTMSRDFSELVKRVFN